LRALIIDDEPLAHEVILHHLRQHQDIHIVGQCFSATEALKWLAAQQTDLMLLDINMPGLSGIELLKVLANCPQVILISAYQQYALQGYELDVTDYLLKPVSAERLLQALDKVRRRANELANNVTDNIVLKVDREKRKFKLDTISLFEAYGNYVKVWQGKDVTLVNSTLKLMLQNLPKQQFAQIHKSYIVNKTHIVAADKESVRLSSDKNIKVGKSFKSALPELMSNIVILNPR
jgi:DNA-binding LytR/AlgR family response regulator